MYLVYSFSFQAASYAPYYNDWCDKLYGIETETKVLTGIGNIALQIVFDYLLN